MNGLKPECVGAIGQHIIDLLGLRIQPQTPVFVGKANIDHMKTKHPHDFAKYGAYIGFIVAKPDYAGLNTTDGSIELVKEFLIEGDYVKVAIRATNNGVYFVRSLYVLNKHRANNFIQKGTLIPLT